MTGSRLHSCLLRFPAAALELTADGVVRESNGRLDALVGRDLVGLPLSEVLDSSSQGKWERILDRNAPASPACRWELVVTTPDSMELRTFLAVWGGDQPDELLWLLEYSVDPKLEQLYGELTELHRDVVEAQRQLGRERTRLTVALEKAEAAIRSRDDVLAIVSHDLRNPVNTITMAAGILEFPIPDQLKAEQIAIIRRAAHGMNRLIGDLLDVSAIESGRLSLELETIQLEGVVTETVEMFREQAGKKKQALEWEVPAELPPLRADRYRVQQVLTNLIGNAIKFTPEAGAIRVTVLASAGDLSIQVRDTGPGIDGEHLQHIFDRFWHTSRKRHGGAGLGLAISKGIAVAHGGRLSVESEPGEGAVFTLTLPIR
jgi:signal transduction histidine kinase